VTSVRQMFGMPMHLDWRKRVAAGSLVGPRQVVGSPLVDGADPFWPGSKVVAKPAEAAGVVKELKDAGYAFIKVYSKLDRDSFLAIAAEAKKQGIPFGGHVPDAVSVWDAVDAGQLSIEHMTGVMMATSSQEAKLRAEAKNTWGKASMATGIDPKRLGRLMVLGAKAMATHDPKKAEALFARMKEKGTNLVPTFTVLRAMSSLRDPKFLADDRLQFLPESYAKMWDPKNDPRFAHRTDEHDAQSRRSTRKLMELAAAANRAGVRILAGTDVPNPFCFPGFSLHDELGLLVEAGLTPMEALQAATRNPAEMTGETSVGTVEAGKLADLVLLDADPLADIGNTRKIHAVVLGGRIFSRADLDGMLADARRMRGLRSVAEELAGTLEKDGLPAALAAYPKLKAQPGYEVREPEMNMLGYELLQKKKVKEAVAVFRLAAEAFPQSANAHDSLGEALLADGDRAGATAEYRRTLELDPGSESAKRQLEKLSAP
jgi:imidazolonepropionase-like amidohydrolase